MSTQKKKHYTKEFKIEAIRLANTSDKPVAQVARELGIRQNQIYKWKQALERSGSGAFRGAGHPIGKEPEIERLCKELEAAKEEIEILKKADAYFANLPE
jgi:transposase